MTELSPLREALVEFAVADLHVDLESPDSPQPRTDAQQSLINKFNMNGKGGAWCADINGYRFEEIARQAAEINPDIEPLLAHEKTLSTMKLTQEAEALGALIPFNTERLPQPADLITFGYVKEEHIVHSEDENNPYLAIGKMGNMHGLSNFEDGQHTAMVIQSWIIDDPESPDHGWIAAVTIDGGISLDPDYDKLYDKTTISPSIYLIHPETGETQIYYDIANYPQYPDAGLTGKVAAMGYIDIESLPFAAETNLALEQRGGFDSPNYNIDGPGYLDIRNQALAQITPNILHGFPESASEILGPAYETLKP